MIVGLILDDTLDKPDGVQQSVLSIGKELTRIGHEVHYIVSETKRNDIENIHSLGKFISIKFNGNSVRTPLPVSSKKINELFSQVNFDVLHVQMPYSPFLAAKVLKMAPPNVRKFGTFHILPYGFLSKFGTKILGLILSSSVKSLDKCFAVSKPALNFMKYSFGISGSVLSNPVNYEFFARYRKTSNKNNIVFIGRFDERKGVKELVQAWRLIPEEIRLTHKLIMCGKGPLLQEVKSISETNNLNINFPGFVSEEEKAKYLSEAQIAVFPSKSGESFGIVLTEAMSSGAGVTIGGNNPGYSSVLAEWPETLFDATNPTVISEKLTQLIKNKNLREKIGDVQKARVSTYDVRLVVKELDSIYKSFSLPLELKK